MILVTILLIIFLILAIICFNFIVDYALIIYPIKGLMAGILYDSSVIEEEEIKEHTLQICIYLVCFTFIWDTEI
jgi:hypothetical protein